MNPTLRSRGGATGFAILGILLTVACATHVNVQPMPALDLSALRTALSTIQGPGLSDTVDTRPTLIHNGRLKFPSSALHAGLQGWVVLDAIVGVDGRPELGSVRAVALSDSVFLAPALRSIENATFSPGTKNGAPVRVLVRVPIVFRIARP
jgi:outer membrane biosynthesis protein TonB